MQHWIAKFRNALRGIATGIAGQTSFQAHAIVCVSVVLLALTLACPVWQWTVLLLCMALVLSLELINSALESLARGVCPEYNREVGDALDIAAGAVLIASVSSVVIGLLIFGARLAELWGF